MDGILDIAKSVLRSMRRDLPSEATLVDCGLTASDLPETARQDDQVLDRMQRMAGVFGAGDQLHGADRFSVFDMARKCARCGLRGTCTHGAAEDAAAACPNAAEYGILVGKGRRAD